MGSRERVFTVWGLELGDAWMTACRRYRAGVVMYMRRGQLAAYNG